ncbi:ribonuclease catalytic domain-containing protein [uncultured Aquabacterium sp.]|uniref:ribonuclease catalytic domain-containing protein n=1 Tax=Aquabacterium sp. TaxID=1872578 RepID=UPI0025E1149D|nr:ribonuclease catalytic domain-containing protein [uncultured Aquabacterium sp.]
MFALFDDAGKFLAGRVMSEADSSMQIELDSGKRVKVKAANVLIKFAKPAPAELLAQAAAQSADIDVDLVWEVAPDEDFGFEDLAREYFSASADAVQQAAMLMRLFETPHYFHRRGKGRFKKAPEDILKQALAAIERKKQQALQIAEWAQELAAGRCPQPIKEQLYKILFKPDKNGPEYKAVVDAAKATQRAPLDLLKGAGAIDSPYQFHFKRFLFEHFPKGTGFPALAAPPITDELPLAPVQAFSIDDSMTTEIDDALSVQGLGSGTVTYGIHIAAPGLAIAPGTPVDALARGRMSTVYMPGHKITMLPDDVVQAYTLIEGRDCPAVSLYVTFDEATLAVKGSETKLERVPIAANLRHDKLDGVITEASLTGEAPADYAFAPELTFAFRLARHLKAQREVVRGKPETFNRPDYTFKLLGANGENTMSDGIEPTGTEQVVIGTRQRGSALDLIVAEAMILANSTWGGWLAELGVPGIYRSQASLAPGIKVRMGTKALPHAGMGVAQYTWATSPLRRYVDLVNQWQIVACARHGRTAALAAPFKPKDAALFAIISGFDGAYSAYNGFQSSMERYWTLKHLQQQQIAELDAAVMVNGLVRADTLPLVFKAIGADGLPRHAKVRVRITGLDELTLDVHASVVARLDDSAPSDAGDAEGEAEDDLPDNAGALTLAIDVNDADTPAADTPAA